MLKKFVITISINLEEYRLLENLMEKVGIKNRSEMIIRLIKEKMQEKNG